MLGLPDGVTACLFDMDGVVTKTAVVHAAAWKQMFDEFLQTQPGQAPFDSVKDYDDYVDGKPRLDGTESFLESRHISLPTGDPDDKPGTPTVYGLSNRKNELVLEVLKRDGVEVYPGSRRYIDAVRKAGLKTAIVSSSANTEAVLQAGGVADLFDARVDANVAKDAGPARQARPRHLPRGRPDARRGPGRRRRLRGRAGRRRGRPGGQVRAGGRRRPSRAGRRAAGARRRRGGQGPGGPSVTSREGRKALK